MTEGEWRILIFLYFSSLSSASGSIWHAVCRPAWDSGWLLQLEITIEEMEVYVSEEQHGLQRGCRVMKWVLSDVLAGQGTVMSLERLFNPPTPLPRPADIRSIATLMAEFIYIVLSNLTPGPHNRQIKPVMDPLTDVESWIWHCVMRSAAFWWHGVVGNDRVSITASTRKSGRWRPPRYLSS